MQAGASTACFYPLETERALQQVTELGFPFAEVFFNARQELRPAFVRQLAAIAGDGGTQVVSVHPFSSFMESSCIFGDYQRRFEDTIDIYKETCHAAALLGAQFVVIHGAVAQPKIPIPEERYFARFLQLVEIGRAEGVTVCQENVNRFKSQHIAFCDRMRARWETTSIWCWTLSRRCVPGRIPLRFWIPSKRRSSMCTSAIIPRKRTASPRGREALTFSGCTALWAIGCII